MSITQQLIPIYNTTVHKNKRIIALNVAKPGLPPGNDKIRRTLSTAENFVPQQKKIINFF